MLQSALCQWLGEAAGPDDPDVAAEMRPRRAANMHYMLCMENAIKAGTGYSLSDFLPLRRPTRLESHETREVVYLGREQGVGQQRVAVLNRSSGKRVLEHPKHLDKDGRAYLSPSLVVCVDQGSVGWPCVQMAFQAFGLRGYYSHDPWHRIWNDLKAACVATSFWSIVREGTLAMNVRCGPFQGAAFHGQLQSTLKVLKSSSSFDNVFFQATYNAICHEWGLQGALDYGSEEHMLTVFRQLCESSELSHKGSNVKWARWASFFDSGHSFRECWSARLCVMLFHGWREGWWESLSASPLGLENGDDYGVRGLLATSKAAGQASGMATKSIKHSNETVELLRKECKNTLEMATLVMHNNTTRRMFSMLIDIVDPIRIQMGKDMKVMQKGKDGTMHVLKSWSIGQATSKTCRAVLLKLQDRDALDWAGIDLASDGSQSAADVLVENEMAKRMVALAREVCAGRSFSMGEYSHAPPFMFVQVCLQ